MPVKYTYSSRDHVIYVTCFGELNIQQIRKYFHDVFHDRSIMKGAVEFVDLSAITLFDLNYTEAAEMPKLFSPNLATKKLRATFLYGVDPINHGLASLIKAYFNKQIPEHAFQVVPGLDDAQIAMRNLLLKDGR